MSYLDIYNIEGGAKYNEWQKLGIGLFIVAVIVVIILAATGVFSTESDKTVESVPTTTVSTPSIPVIQTPQLQEQPPVLTTQPPSKFTNLEPFTNDLPYELDNQKITLKEDEDYSEILQQMALDKEVITQHKQYVNDRNKITSTASFDPERSDSQDIVTRWGLTSIGYVKQDPSAREVPSQDPEQGSKPIKLRWG
jgi:hypothetical protein